MPQCQVWIGLVNVAPMEGNPMLLVGKRGAYVNVLAWAVDEVEFEAKVVSALSNERFAVVEMEDVEPFSKRAQEYTVDERLSELADHVQRFKSVEFGAFHTYENDDISA